MNTSDFKDWKGNKERIFCLNDQKYYIEIQKKNILRNPYAILVEGGGGGGAIHPLNILCLIYC